MRGFGVDPSKASPSGGGGGGGGREEEEETLPNREAERRQRSKRGHLKTKRGEGEEEMRASGGRGSREDVGARRLGIVASVRASATR